MTARPTLQSATAGLAGNKVPQQGGGTRDGCVVDRVLGVDIPLRQAALRGLPAPAATSANAAAAAPGAAALPVVPACESIETRRSAIVASFRAALDVAGAELLPAFTAAHLPADADTLYKLAFSVWRAWLDAGLVA